MNLSPHFMLEELVPEDAVVPAEVLTNLTSLCTTLLEPIRQAAGLPVVVHDAYRPAGHNTAVGGVPTSDHLTGRAADFHVAASPKASWEENTLAAFEYVRANMRGAFGQLILEDHRKALSDPMKLWVHVSTPSPKHPGANDPDAVLLSKAPMQYAILTDDAVVGGQDA